MNWIEADPNTVKLFVIVSDPVIVPPVKGR